MTSTAPAPAGIPVVVTTEHRGVFFGWLDGQDATATTLRLEQAQMCVYWSADIGGVLGLADPGPGKGCRIGPVVPAITLHKVTSVTEASSKAVTAWQARPWS